jgi:predicted alpha/beta-hydrolase family hydrolase
LHWEAAGLDVTHVALDLSGGEAELRERFIEVVQSHRGRSAVVIGGFSLGARIAAQASSALEPLGLLCLGYPFHVRGDPGDRHGLETLRGLHTPSLIVQGTRDPHGNREEVTGYGQLPSCVRLHWLEDGNHRFRPRKASGQTELSHVRRAAAASAEFIVRTLESQSHA